MFHNVTNYAVGLDPNSPPGFFRMIPHSVTSGPSLYDYGLIIGLLSLDFFIKLRVSRMEEPTDRLRTTRESGIVRKRA
jgi:hypothetical protein